MCQKKSKRLICLASLKFYCLLWDNLEDYGRAGHATDDNIMRHMLIVCGITKTTNTRSEYVILIAIPQQQWLRDCKSM